MINIKAGHNSSNHRRHFSILLLSDFNDTRFKNTHKESIVYISVHILFKLNFVNNDGVTKIFYSSMWILNNYINFYIQGLQ